MHISIADVTISNFYHQEQFTFLIALSVAIFAQIGYAIAFVLTYADYHDPLYSSAHLINVNCGWFWFGVVLSPVMSVIFYWTSDPDMCLAQTFKHNLGLSIEKKASDKYVYRYKWVEDENKKNRKITNKKNGLKQK